MTDEVVETKRSGAGDVGAEGAKNPEDNYSVAPVRSADDIMRDWIEGSGQVVRDVGGSEAVGEGETSGSLSDRMRNCAEEAETAENLKECLESFAAEVDGLLDSIRVLRGLAAGKQMRIDELTRNLHVADGEIAAAKKQLSDLKNINVKLERQRKEAVQNEDKARMAWSLCQSENRALQARVDELLRATQARPS